MASIQKKGDAFYCQFYFQRKRHTITIGKVSKAKADAFAIGVEDTLELIRTGRLTVPSHVTIADFVAAGGKVCESPVHSTMTFSQLCQAYLDTHSIGSMEANSLETVRRTVSLLSKQNSGSQQKAQPDDRTSKPVASCVHVTRTVVYGASTRSAGSRSADEG